MALNLNALKNRQKAFEEKGSGNVVQASKLGEEFDFRVIPPIYPEQDGIYFLERKIWWINGKPYTSPATFGDEDVIEEEIAEATELAKRDKTLSKLLNDERKLKSQTEYWIPVLLLDVEFDSKSKPKKVSVKEDKVKVLAMGGMLMKAVNKIAVGRQYQNGTDDGFADRIEGYNILATKTGTGLNTEYSAEGWREPWEMDEKYYTEKAVPNIIELARKQIKSDDYLRSVIRNYLYGEAIIEDKKKDDDDDDKRPVARKAADDNEGGRKPSRARKIDDDDNEGESTASSRRKSSAARKTSDEDTTASRRSEAAPRNIVDDVKSGLDALEDD